MSSVAPGDTTQAGTGRNPLVDRGWSGPLPATMGNGQVISEPPGFLAMNAASQNTWAFHAWQHDGEGMANVRIFRHPAFPMPEGWPYEIDVGADELGETVITGMRFGTTAFLAMKNVPNVPNRDFENKYLWFIGMPGTLSPPVIFGSRPKLREVQHLGDVPDGAAAYKMPMYTGWFGPWEFFATITTANYYLPPFPAITPHLLPDIHSWWHKVWPGLGPTNPFWRPCDSVHNPQLFLNPTAGVIHAPGLWPDLAGAYHWLDETLNVPPHTIVFQLFGPFGRTGQLPAYDIWCRGYDGANPTQTYDVLPPTHTSAEPWRAIRFSVEPEFSIWGNSGTIRNSQSFTVVVEQGS